MASRVDYSYRYPIDRSPQFPLLPNAQFKQANRTSVTGTTGQFDALVTDIQFGNPSVVHGKKLPYTGRLDQHIPLERNLRKIHPGRDKDWSSTSEPPAARYNLSDFHRYRRLKDYQPKLVPRIEDILAYKYCPTCCALHVGGCIGCRRDDRYSLKHTTGRMPWDHQRPRPPFGRGYYGYLHEKLDNHSTGSFRLSKYH